MGGSKPKAVQTPFQQSQQQQNTFSLLGPGGSQEAKDLLDVDLNFGLPYTGGAYKDYSGDAYKDIKTDFNIDPGVGRRTDLAEQSNQNRWNSAFFGGMPQEYRQILRDSESRNIRSQGAAERQQAEYGRQQLEGQASLQRAQMRDASELNHAQLRDSSELNQAGFNSQRIMAELERRNRLLPQIVQTGGSGSSSGYNTQIMPGQQGLLGGFLGGLGAGVGGALKLPKI